MHDKKIRPNLGHPYSSRAFQQYQSATRDIMVWEILTSQIKQINKLPSFIDRLLQLLRLSRFILNPKPSWDATICAKTKQCVTGVAGLTLFIYLWRKVVCFVLFCSYEIHQTGMLQIVFLVSLESPRRGGCVGLVPWCLDLLCKSSWILNDFFTEN
jgi:hypothetical protein